MGKLFFWLEETASQKFVLDTELEYSIEKQADVQERTVSIGNPRVSQRMVNILDSNGEEND